MTIALHVRCCGSFLGCLSPSFVAINGACFGFFQCWLSLSPLLLLSINSCRCRGQCLSVFIVCPLRGRQWLSVSKLLLSLFVFVAFVDVLVGVIVQASLAVFIAVIINFVVVTLCCYKSSTLWLLSSLTADNKFSSFQRQLNLYGFRKVVKGRESGCYMHPSFLRDNPEKLTEVCYVFAGRACSRAIGRALHRMIFF